MNTANSFNVPAAWHIRMLRNPMISIGFAILCLLLDYFMEPFIRFPITFIIPVAIAAWFCHSSYAYFLATLQPMIRLGYVYFQHAPEYESDSIMNTVIRIIVLVLFAYLVSRTAHQKRELAKRVNLLEGILPVCNLCKKIRDEHGDWQPMEIYVSNRSEALFNQSLCPDCLKRDYKNTRSST